MAHQSDREELVAAWRALSDATREGDGWNTIPLSGGGRARAGRQFPGNEEAVLIGFAIASVPANDHLPQGNGFLVTRIDFHDSGEMNWLALSRRREGSLEIFIAMVLDVVGALQSTGGTTEAHQFHLFLTRIRAWQDFMRRGADTKLSLQAEIGLFGELVTMHHLMSAGLHPAIPVEAWVGPLSGAQDFNLGTGAIEVKTTIATTGFPAVIESLDQLDDATRQPLFLAAVRLKIDDDSALSLPELVQKTRTSIGDDPARSMLDTKLLHAGYMDAAADHYQRRFAVGEIRILGIGDGFPRLTRGVVPPMIVAVRYELDIEHVAAETVTIEDAIERLGVLSNGAY